jgi:flavin-dependent dehydrogenase
MVGMSAAHELIERGFAVVVLERGEIAGGKARSVPVVDEGPQTSGYQLGGNGGLDRAPAAGEARVPQSECVIDRSGALWRTNLVWIKPWLAYLESSGVRYVKDAEVEEILGEGERIASVAARQAGKRPIRARRPLPVGPPDRARRPDDEQPAADLGQIARSIIGIAGGEHLPVLFT